MARLSVILCLFALAMAGFGHAAATLPPGFVRLADVAPEIAQDIRYATSNNFTGRPVAGYLAADCWLRREAAQALALVAKQLEKSGWRIIVYDCYRPQRAVADFVHWAHTKGGEERKAEFFPAIAKQNLFALGYIARASAHSTGLAVDAGAVLPGGQTVDFGSGFDLFDPRSATASKAIPSQASANRQILTAAFAAHGFAGYAREWWHFSYRAAGATLSLDAPVIQLGQPGRGNAS